MTRPRLPWWAGVFAAALAVRLAGLWLLDEPIRYSDQYFYLIGGLQIAGDPHPLRLILTSDSWRLWGGHWTIAPLYYIFVGLLLRVFGASLFVVQLVQCVLGAATAVGVAALAREAAGPRGTGAGVAYAVYWPAVEMTQRVLTENLHVPLLLAALALAARAARTRSSREAGAAGALLGVSALVRSVSSSFVPVAAWIVLGRRGEHGRWKPAVVLVAAAAGAILPWSARNLIGTGTLAPIESLWAFNLLRDNSYEKLRRYEGDFYFQSKDPAEAARSAPRFLLRNFAANPWGLAEKVEMNSAKVVRAEGLHMALDVERPAPFWLLLASIGADDLMLFVAFPLFGAFLLAGERTGGWWTVVLWTAYYVFMIAVLFHVETRYRSALVPVLLAGAAGGAGLLRETTSRRRVAIGAVLGAIVSVAAVASYVPAAWRAVVSWWDMRTASEALARGDRAAAQRQAGLAFTRDPTSGRTWTTWGGALARAGRTEDAIDAFRRAAEARPRNPVPRVVLPQLLREAGRPQEATAALAEAHDVAERGDNWLALEEAWAALPPPRRDQLQVGDDDFGAVRGFFPARGTYRWTWKRSWLRLMPTVAAPAYAVTLVMGSPDPSPLAAPVVSVRAVGAPEARFTLDRAARPFTVTARPGPGEPVIVEVESPTWTRAGENAEQGVAIGLMTVVPAGG